MSDQATTKPEAENQAVSEKIPAEMPVRLQILSSSFKSSYPCARNCFVLGATGESGKRISRLLIESGAFSLIKLIIRREFPAEDLPKEIPANVKIVRYQTKQICVILTFKEQVVIPDFETIQDDTDIFKECE